MVASASTLAAVAGATYGSSSGDGSSGGASSDAASPDSASADGGGGGDGGTSGPVVCDGSVACERVVFVTGQLYKGDLGGLDGGDDKCAAAAGASIHPRVHGRSYSAWLSVPSTDASSRLVHGAGAYVRPDGARVAADWGALTSGALEIPIALDENGVGLDGGFAWTATQPNGTAQTKSPCKDWSTAFSGETGARGSAGATDARWTSGDEISCLQQAHLYCVER